MEIIKTTHLLLSSLLLFFIGCTNAQWNNTIKGSGKITTETRSVDAYDALSVHGRMNTLLVEGSEGSIKLTVEDNILEYIEVTILMANYASKPKTTLT